MEKGLRANLHFLMGQLFKVNLPIKIFMDPEYSKLWMDLNTMANLNKENLKEKENMCIQMAAFIKDNGKII